jgi:hypothetical protein
MKRQLWVIVLEVKCTSLLISEEIPKATGRNLSLQAKRYLWSTGTARNDSMETMTDFKLTVGMTRRFGQGGEGRGGGGWGDKS